MCIDIEGAFTNLVETINVEKQTNSGFSWEETTTEKHCSQGGILKPLLWSLVVDYLIRKLNVSGFTAQGYSDDLVVIVRGKHDEIISYLMQTAPKYD